MPPRRDIDFSGYQLQTRTVAATNDTLRHRFSSGTILTAGTSLVVFGGGVLDSSKILIFGGAKLLRASTGGLSLSNGGGVVTLRDAASSVITSIAYGPK